MTSVFKSSRVLIFCSLLVCVHGGELVPPPSTDVFSVAEGETRLPCQYKPSDDQVVQVMWSKEKSDGTKEQIIVAHHINGLQEYPEYEGRVRFESIDPMVNSALIIMNTRISDESKYICTITTFPSGTVESQLSLTVWSSPISSLDTVTLVEGQVFGVVATCRSVAKPQAGLSWDTDLPGQSQNRSLEKDMSSIQFSLHPLRSMNGRKLDCLVWHPTLKTPKRHSSQLVVYYPPNAVITGYDDNWFVGLEGVTLQCDGQGNPKPDTFTWTRKDGGLPEGVTVEKGVLRFNRPLNLTDAGVYECMATNQAGSGKSDLEVTVIEEPVEPMPLFILLVIIVGCVAVLVVIVLVTVVLTVNRHYKRKNKALTIELNEKREEISTLSRQASIRRVNSVNTDCKYQMDEVMPLRIEGTLRTSLSSLDHPRSRDSRSTLGGTVDTLGRPVIYNTSRRGRERAMEREREGEREFSRLKVEAFVKSSNMSLVHSESHFLPPLQTAEPVRSRNGSAILPAEGRPQSGGGSRAGSRTGSRAGSRGHHSPLSSSNYPTLTDEEESDLSPADKGPVVLAGAVQDVPESIDSETVSSQISDALSSHFEHTNVKLWSNSKPNNILLGPGTNGFHPVHNGIMNHHHPQIV